MSARASGSASGSTSLPPDEYDSLLEHVRETVDAAVPRNATVLVVSRGDDELLRIGPRRALHFPADEFGSYAGYHPEDGGAAIAALEDMRARGGEYLLLPRTAFWWLDFYEDLGDHLERNYRAIAATEGCMVFELVAGVQPPPPEADNGQVPATTTSSPPLDGLLRALVPTDAGVAVAAGGVAGVPSFPHSHAVGAHDDLPTLLAAADATGADFLVVPAGATDRVHAGREPPAAAGHWRIVTRQRHLGEVWERHGSQPASRRRPDGRWRRILDRFRKG